MSFSEISNVFVYLMLSKPLPFHLLPFFHLHCTVLYCTVLYSVFVFQFRFFSRCMTRSIIKLCLLYNSQTSIVNTLYCFFFMPPKRTVTLFIYFVSSKASPSLVLTYLSTGTAIALAPFDALAAGLRSALRAQGTQVAPGTRQPRLAGQSILACSTWRQQRMSGR